MTCELSNPPKHPGGRPPYDRIQIGKDFVKWATNNPEALTVPMYAVSIGLHSGILRAWALEDAEFSALFKEAKEQIGINRLRCARSDTLSDGIYRAHIGNYDIDVNEYMRDEKRFEKGLEKETQQAVNSDITSRLDKTLAQISLLQESSLNSAKSKIIKDEKS